MQSSSSLQSQQPFKNERFVSKKKPVNPIPKSGIAFRDHHPSHSFTFIFIAIFSFLLFYRPFEMFPQLSSLSSIVLPVAFLTVLSFIFSQINSNGPFFDFTVETKCVFFMTLIGVLLLPITVNKEFALNGLRDGLGKVSIIFFILTIVISTIKRVLFFQWLLFGAAVILIVQLLDLYRQGVFLTENYRITTGYGMIGNPNEASIFLLIVLPITLTLIFLKKSILIKAALSVSILAGLACVFLTQSRGGFLGLVTVTLILIWKLGKKGRIKISLISLVFFSGILFLAPSDYSTRIIAIFDSSKDRYGSSGERSELLKRSLIVSARNPWGVGLANSGTFGVRNLETHNAYTQVSSELGIAGLIAFIIFLYYPLRELNRVEKETFNNNDKRWYYYQSVGLQAGIGGFVVTCFFASVAYQWYIFYPVALAIAVRKMYLKEKLDEASVLTTS